MNRNNLILVGTIIVGLGIGTIIGLQQIKSSKTTTAEEPVKQEETTDQRLTPEQALAEYTQTRTAEQKAEAIEKIKSIFGEDLVITFKEAKTRYYSYGIPDPAAITDFAQLKVIEIYEDNKEFKTEIDAETNEILKREKDCTTETQWVTLEQAKETAKNLLAKIVENPENYTLQEDKGWAKVYWVFWRKQNEGEFYNLLPAGKGQTLAKFEERTIAICLLNGELMSYEYKPALTEKEIIKMANQWAETQRKDIEALRRFLNSPSKQFTFVNYLGCSECGEGGTPNSFRVYRDEDGYCYDIDLNGIITPDTEMLKGCKTPQFPRPEPISDEKLEEIRNFKESPEDIEAIKKFIGKPDAKIIFVRNEIAEGKWIKIYREENDPCVLYGIDENGEIHRGREPIEDCRIP